MFYSTRSREEEHIRYINSFIIFNTQEWKYLRCDRTVFLIDGERIPLEVDHDGHIKKGITEFITIE